MSISLAPTLFLMRKAAKSHRSLESAARDVVTVCPAEETIRPQAYSLPGQLDRVKSFQEMGGREAQLARISAGPVTHAATRAFRFRNAVLLGGCLFAGGARSQLTMSRPPRFPKGTKTVIEKASLVGTPLSDIFFGHYLMDDSATTLLAEEFAPPKSPESKNRPGWRHANDYRRLMNLEVPSAPASLIAEAWLFEDIGMNAHRRKRMQAVRQRLAGFPAERSGHSVFIVRSKHGQTLRLLENEMDLADILEKRGFTVVDPMNEPVESIIRKISGAALVVSVEGSALTHAYLTMQEQGAMITIQPPHRFDNVWKDFTDLLGMRYGFVVAEGDRDSFRVDPDDVLRTIDLIA